MVGRDYQRLPAESAVDLQPPLPGREQVRVTLPLEASSIVKVPPPAAAFESTERLKVSSVPLIVRFFADASAGSRAISAAASVS